MKGEAEVARTNGGADWLVVLPLTEQAIVVTDAPLEELIADHCARQNEATALLAVVQHKMRAERGTPGSDELSPAQAHETLQVVTGGAP